MAVGSPLPAGTNKTISLKGLSFWLLLGPLAALLWIVRHQRCCVMQTWCLIPVLPGGTLLCTKRNSGICTLHTQLVLLGIGKSLREDSRP